MNSLSSQLLTGPIPDAEIWAEGLGRSFQEMGKALGANCGVVVLYSEEEQAYLERASFGYDEEGFYYEFLARGLGNFEKISQTEKPYIFPKHQGFSLYHSTSSYAVVVRVFSEAFLGFLLLEFSESMKQEAAAWTAHLFASRVGYIAAMHSEKILPISHADEQDFIQDILNTFEDWEQVAKRAFQKGYLSLSSDSGKIKNRIIKHLHQLAGKQGELLFISLLPDQVVKLERSLVDWFEIAKSGTIVFENIASIQLSQQRLLFEAVRDGAKKTLFIFWTDSEFQIPSGYSPFQKIVKENWIKIPAIYSLGKEKRLSIFQGLIKEVCNLYSRKNITVSMEALDFLEEKAVNVRLEEIQNVLEASILKCKDSSLSRMHLEEEWGDREKSISMHDMEDLDLRKSVEAVERQKILLALKLFSGNQMRMAKALGISRGSLQYKMKQMGL
jgi:hypothetical protein